MCSICAHCRNLWRLPATEFHLPLLLHCCVSLYTHVVARRLPWPHDSASTTPPIPRFTTAVMDMPTATRHPSTTRPPPLPSPSPPAPPAPAPPAPSYNPPATTRNPAATHLEARVCITGTMMPEPPPICKLARGAIATARGGMFVVSILIGGAKPTPSSMISLMGVLDAPLAAG